MKIRTKIIGMGLLFVLITAVSIVGITFYQKNVLNKAIDRELEGFIRGETRQVAEGVYLMCRAMQQSIEESLAHGQIVARRILHERGSLAFGGERVRWQAMDQYSRKIRDIELPRMMIGRRWLGRESSMSVSVPVVDQVRDLLGMTCTIFQRMNEDGDMLRVATNVPNPDGARAIGTYIPRHHDDGTADPVVERLLRGQVFTGCSFVVDAWYVAHYQPLWDATGKKVVGALYVGRRQESLESLRQGIVDIVVGKTGSVAVLSGHGRQRGQVLIARQPSRGASDPVNLGEQAGRMVVQRLLRKTMQLSRDGQQEGVPVQFERYWGRGAPDQYPRQKLAATTYFEPWDWVIVVSACLDDYRDVRQRMAGSLTRMIVRICQAALAIVLLSVVIGFAVARGIVRPLERAIVFFERVGQGRLDCHLDLDCKDEIGQLARAFNHMVDNLRTVTASRDELNREIIERTRMESKLRAASARRQELEAIVNRSPAVAFLWRAGDDWPVELVTENVRQFGYDPEGFYSGKVPFLSILHPADLDRVLREAACHVEQRKEAHFSIDCRIINRSGDVRWVDNRIWVRRDAHGIITHYQGVMLDVTDRKQAEKQVQRLAFYDELTHLPNRALFLNRLSQSMAQSDRDGRKIALMYLDLDHFKEINDTFGHAVGDMVLQATAERLNSCVRRNDTVARLGGDEIILLLPGVENGAQVEAVAKKILKVMASPFCFGTLQVTVTPSIGIVLFPTHGRDVSTLLKRADIAMYAAKQGGRCRYLFFSEDMERNSKVVGVHIQAVAAEARELPPRRKLPWPPAPPC
jgi:diguanylate cyclase (GGDEF)-like protein/PAS domain S-box-containing protein